MGSPRKLKLAVEARESFFTDSRPRTAPSKPCCRITAGSYCCGCTDPC